MSSAERGGEEPDLFADMLAPLSTETFLSEIMGITHRRCEGRPGRFGHLMSWSKLSQILLEHRLDYPRLRLVQRGKTIPAAEYISTEMARRAERFRRPDAESVERLMRGGAMLHLAAVDELNLPVSQLAASVESAVGSKCFVNLHAGLHTSKGFDTHWDGHEVCVLQVEGRKFWRVFGETDHAPLAVAPDQKGPPPSETIWEGMLECGDFLYMPRGCWHSAEAIDGPSLHLSVGWENPTGGDFLRWLMEASRNELALRIDGPIDRHEINASPLVERLHQTIRPLVSERAYLAFLGERRQAATMRRHTMSLP